MFLFKYSDAYFKQKQWYHFTYYSRHVWICIHIEVCIYRCMHIHIYAYLLLLSNSFSHCRWAQREQNIPSLDVSTSALQTAIRQKQHGYINHCSSAHFFNSTKPWVQSHFIAHCSKVCSQTSHASSRQVRPFYLTSYSNQMQDKEIASKCNSLALVYSK